MYHCTNVYCIKHLFMHLLSVRDICSFVGDKKSFDKVKILTAILKYAVFVTTVPVSPTTVPGLPYNCPRLPHSCEHNNATCVLL